MDQMAGRSTGWGDDGQLYAAIAVAVIAVQAAVLYAMGMSPICRCGTIALWHGNPSGPETSQHLTDWYTYTHVLHGVVFYFVLSLVAPRLSIARRLLIAVALEAAWEIFENTPMVMERYRRGALAQGYFGDSIVNSVSDSAAAVAGFLIAWRLPVALVAALVVGAELAAGYVIRDGLVLNLIQLVHPSEVVSQWQARR